MVKIKIVIGYVLNLLFNKELNAKIVNKIALNVLILAIVKNVKMKLSYTKIIVLIIVLMGTLIIQEYVRHVRPSLDAL